MNVIVMDWINHQTRLMAYSRFPLGATTHCPCKNSDNGVLFLFINEESPILFISSRNEWTFGDWILSGPTNNSRMSDFLKRRERWMRTDDESKYEKKKTNSKLKQQFHKIWNDEKEHFYKIIFQLTKKEGNQKSYAQKRLNSLSFLLIQ